MFSLTPKQEKFCNLYVQLGNASKAYRAAYNCEKMKPETVNETASKLLNNPKVATRVRELRSELKEKSDIEKDEAVKHLTNIVRLNPLDYIEVSENVKISSEGSEIAKETVQIVVVKDLNALSKEQQQCIKSITPTKFGLKVEFESKIGAIDRLSKMLDWDTPIKEEVDHRLKGLVIQVTNEKTKNNLHKLESKLKKC